MLDNSISITYNAEAVTLYRLNQDGYTGLFQGALASGDDLTLEVKHTIPSAPGKPEQHLCKLTLVQYAVVNGVTTLSRTTSVHTVIKTSFGVEDDTTSLRLKKALDTFMTDVTVDKVLDRRS